MKKEAQKVQILKYLSTGHKLTHLEAIYLFGCYQLATRVFELKRQGHNIQSEWIEKNGKRFKAYYLEVENA